MMRARHAAGPRGVTLLELVVTLTILAMIGVLVLQAVRLGSRSWLRGEERADAEQRLRTLYGTVAQGLASLQSVGTLADGTLVVAFEGRPDRLAFETAPAQGPLPFAGMSRALAYSVEAGRGLVLHESYPAMGGIGSEAAAAEVLDAGVARLKLRYLRPGGTGGEAAQWVDSWRSEQLPAEVLAMASAHSTVLETHRTLPLAVEMTLLLRESGGEREVSFVVPVRVGRAVSELGER